MRDQHYFNKNKKTQLCVKKSSLNTFSTALKQLRKFACYLHTLTTEKNDKFIVCLVCMEYIFKTKISNSNAKRFLCK